MLTKMQALSCNIQDFLYLDKLYQFTYHDPSQMIKKLHWGFLNRLKVTSHSIYDIECNFWQLITDTINNKKIKMKIYITDYKTIITFSRDFCQNRFHSKQAHTCTGGTQGTLLAFKGDFLPWLLKWLWWSSRCPQMWLPQPKEKIKFWLVAITLTCLLWYNTTWGS